MKVVRLASVRLILSLSIFILRTQTLHNPLPENPIHTPFLSFWASVNLLEIFPYINLFLSYFSKVQYVQLIVMIRLTISIS